MQYQIGDVLVERICGKPTYVMRITKINLFQISDGMYHEAIITKSLDPSSTFPVGAEAVGTLIDTETVTYEKIE